ncbi:MAG TPA: hypothetical protein PL048_09195, partial [Leptospiraceae bacterium]|nr:hypothetical protein [Leptospiraceae bacterium]
GGRKWHTALTSKHEIDGVDEAKREAAAGEKRDRRDDEQKAKLLKLLAAYPGGESGSLLRGKLKVGPPRFKELTCLLIDEGKVEQCKFEKNGRFVVAILDVKNLRVHQP